MNILLTGEPGVGKTTIIKNVLQQVDLEAGGFYTQEMRERGRRVGFKIVSLHGEEGILAHVDLPKDHRVGRYGVNISDLEEVGVKSIEENLGKDLIVIDEIGKMELFSDRFKKAVKEALDGRKVLGTIKAGGGGFISQVKKREDVMILNVTTGNRDSLVDEVLVILKRNSVD